MVAIRSCLTAEDIAVYLTSTATAIDLGALERHVDQCEPCRASIAAAVRAGRGDNEEPDAADLQIGTPIGRYIVRAVRGTGAMSHVLEASDPDLDRTIAIKIVRHRDAMDDERALREGRALARLTHPNVVTVFDVGVWTGGVFLAMELVRGQTVREWLATPRAWRDIVRIYAAAARGLDAAHRVGLVHRDVKPDNLVLGDDGRVRVIDFGLAVDHARPDGTLGGTPAYMAPEQREHPAANALSDQYALFVSLYEALEGQRPADDVAVRRRVPAWLRALVQRGLRRAPAERHSDLAEVARRLERGLGRRRRGAIVAGLALASITSIAAVKVVGGESAEGPPICRGAEAQLAGVWSEPRKRAMSMAFAAARRPFADASLATAERLLDTYTSRWVAAKTEACEATRVHGTQSEQLLDLRVACLDERLRGVDALVGVFEKADAKVVENAPRAAQQLPQIEGCADTAALTAPIRPPSDPATARKVAEVRQELAFARASRDAGKFDVAAVAVSSLVTRALALQYAPLIAEVLLLQGVIESDSSKATAESTLSQAADRAEAGRADVVKAEAWTQLVRAAAVRAHYPDAHRHAGHATAALARLGGGHEDIAARLANYEGGAYTAEGDYVHALALHQRALEIRERINGADSPEVATALNSIANVHFNLGHYRDARPAYERSLAIRERVLGAMHPDVAGSHNNLAVLLVSLDDFDAAIAHFLRARVIYDSLLGPGNPRTAQILANLAGVYRDAGRFDEALAALAEALPIQEKASGSDHPLVASALYIKGEIYGDQGKYDLALAAHTRALEIRRAALGDDHPDVAASHDALGLLAMRRGDAKTARKIFDDVLAIQNRIAPDSLDIARTLSYAADAHLETGDVRGALRMYERGLAIDEQQLGPAHPDLAIDLTGVGIARHRLGDARAALEALERALTLAEAPNAERVVRGRAELAAADALWDAGGDRHRARKLAEAAHAAFAKAGAGAKNELAQVERWLASHVAR
ncbi:MAG: serine/threonine kinase family protein [Deltaproteobacteria bacterium]|nr:serine/threonine kinase family protein [Deltaproteobacteria bacterium]